MFNLKYLGRRNEPFNSWEGRASNLLKKYWIVVLRQRKQIVHYALCIVHWSKDTNFTMKSLILAQDER